jgi:hypothetical protein
MAAEAGTGPTPTAALSPLAAFEPGRVHPDDDFGLDAGAAPAKQPGEGIGPVVGRRLLSSFGVGLLEDDLGLRGQRRVDACADRGGVMPS